MGGVNWMKSRRSGQGKEQRPTDHKENRARVLVCCFTDHYATKKKATEAAFSKVLEQTIRPG